jgi:hypothetical protein
MGKVPTLSRRKKHLQKRDMKFRIARRVASRKCIFRGILGGFRRIFLSSQNDLSRTPKGLISGKLIGP